MAAVCAPMVVPRASVAARPAARNAAGGAQRPWPLLLFSRLSACARLPLMAL